MKVSLIVTGGFIKQNNVQKALIESERLLAFNTCLMNLGSMDTSQGDEIIIAEYGLKSSLRGMCEIQLKNVNWKYIFVEGEGFNQSRIKNAGAAIANNEIVCWINSDVLVRKNLFDVLRKRFEQNPRIFAIAARHDVFDLDRGRILSLLSDINNELRYTPFKTALNDAGWHYAMKHPQTPIETSILSFVPAGPYAKFSYDFTQGYINYGELMAVTKEIWSKYPFDEEITAIVDSFIRDIIFGNEEDFQLEMIHDKTAVFHLSGTDYMQQENQGSDKYKRLIEDIIKSAKKYPCMHHWLVFGYFKEFDETIKELNVPFKQLFDKWNTPIMLRYFRDKEHVKKLYGVDFDVK